MDTIGKKLGLKEKMAYGCGDAASNIIWASTGTFGFRLIAQSIPLVSLKPVNLVSTSKSAVKIDTFVSSNLFIIWIVSSFSSICFFSTRTDNGS